MSENDAKHKEVLEQARRAGLDRAVADFPGDVLVAAEAAERARNAFPPAGKPAAEPWPPMRVPE